MLLTTEMLEEVAGVFKAAYPGAVVKTGIGAEAATGTLIQVYDGDSDMEMLGLAYAEAHDAVMVKIRERAVGIRTGVSAETHHAVNTAIARLAEWTRDEELTLPIDARFGEIVEGFRDTYLRLTFATRVLYDNQ